MYRMDSQKHPMTSPRDTAALIRELACSMNDLSAKMEICASWLQMATGLIPTLTLTQMQIKFHFTNGKPRISMSWKFGLRCRFSKPLICLKPLSPSWRNTSTPKEYKIGSTIESKNLLTIARLCRVLQKCAPKWNPECLLWKQHLWYLHRMLLYQIADW